jgi:hypothetical protein
MTSLITILILIYIINAYASLTISHLLNTWMKMKMSQEKYRECEKLMLFSPKLVFLHKRPLYYPLKWEISYQLPVFALKLARGILCKLALSVSVEVLRHFNRYEAYHVDARKKDKSNIVEHSMGWKRSLEILLESYKNVFIHGVGERQSEHAYKEVIGACDYHSLRRKVLSDY